MRRGWAPVFLSCALVLPACASNRTKVEVDVPLEESISSTAKGLYNKGEEEFAQGRYGNAVLLWRHALLQLDESKAMDEVRHKLILRMAHGQLAAFEQTRDRTHLTNAARMLNRYAAKHETLFGDGEDAREDRGQVYEMLYEVESRLEQPEVVVLSQAEPEPTEQGSPEPISEAGDDHAGEEVGDDVRREVVVNTRNRTSIEDPVVRQRLATSFSTGWAGPVLTAAEPVMWNGPRPLVRLSSAPKVLDVSEQTRDDRRAAWDVVRAARPHLEQCYGAAFARMPVLVTEATVTAVVEPDGNVSKVRIQDGGLIDAVGDACLIEIVDSVQVVPGESQGRMTVQLPLKFFYQGANYGSMYFNPDEPRQVAQPGLPTIDEFQHQDR